MNCNVVGNSLINLKLIQLRTTKRYVSAVLHKTILVILYVVCVNLLLNVDIQVEFIPVVNKLILYII